MILDRLSNLGLYLKGDTLRIVKGFLEREDLSELPAGRYDLENGIFVNMCSYEATPETKTECHVKYVDLQYMVKGTEKMLWAPLEDFTITEDKTPAADLKFGTCGKYFAEFPVRPGYYTVFFPEDAHAPGRLIEDKDIVKAVVKIPAEEM